MTMNVQARFFVSTTTRKSYGNAETLCTVELKPVINGDPNTDWSKYTPSGVVELTVTVPETAAWFESRIGRPVAITFADVPEAYGPAGLAALAGEQS